jgi:hypothetical protein
MNAENFAEYLKNPSKLYQTNYQELKSLALQYPYCQNLQWLLLQKSRLDGHKDTDANLEKAAAGSIDRALLYKKVKSIAAIRDKVADLLVTDEVLELPTLSNFRRPEPIFRDSRETDLREQQAPVFKPIESFKSAEVEEDLDFSKLQTPPFTPELPSIEPDPAVIEPLRSPEIPQPNDPMPIHPNPDPQPEIPDPIDPPPTLPDEPRQNEEIEKSTATSIEWDLTPTLAAPEPTPQPNAVSRARRYEPPKLQLKSSAVPPASSKEAQAAEMAAQSVSEKTEVVSETLALILARQGHREKALRMYEQLILKVPEKSAYFAAQIQKLK